MANAEAQLQSASTRASVQFARSFACTGINPRRSIHQGGSQAQPPVGTASGNQVRECIAVVDSTGFKRERLRRILIPGGKTTGQQLEGLRQRRLT